MAELPGGSSLWQVQILCLTASPWHPSDIGKRGFPVFGQGFLPLCLTRCPFTIQESLSIRLEDCVRLDTSGSPGLKTWYLSLEDTQEMMS